MPLDYEALKKLRVPDVVHAYTKRDSMLYALGVGLGADPMDEDQLRFVYEKDLVALPTLCLVIANAGSVSQYPELNITKTHVLHGEQAFRLERPMPVEGTVVGEFKVTRALDKGREKGAVVYTEITLRNRETGEVLGTNTSASFCRADGGFGGPSGPAEPLQEIPSRAPDLSCDLPTFVNAALVYRLSGDYNPLHAEPAFAKRGGFDRPILHGRATYAVACHAIVKTMCGYDPARLRAMQARFSSVVYPGETVRTEIWTLDGGSIAFRATIPARGNAVVLNNGRAEFV